jgi:site-specific recombinase
MSTPEPGKGASDVSVDWQLPELVTSANANASLADRNVWLVRVVRWLMRDAPATNEQGTPFAVLRLRHLLSLLERQPELREQVSGILQKLWLDDEAAALFSDSGLESRHGLVSTLWSGWRDRWLPKSPDTRNLAVLFDMMLACGGGLRWTEMLDDATLCQLAGLFEPEREGSAHEDTRLVRAWWGPLVQAMQWLTASVQAAAFRPELRRFMGHEAAPIRPFELLALSLTEWAAVLDSPSSQLRVQRANLLRGVLQACREAADGAREGMREHGLAANLLFDLQQMQARVDRLDALVDVVMSPKPALAMRTLLVDLAQLGARRRSTLGVIGEHHQLLARKVAERHALSGEHYVARNLREYKLLLRQAACGGVVIGATTLAKFGLVAVGLAPLWSGLTLGAVYALSFVGIFLLHWSLATKQPSLTAATLAARLADMQTARARGETRATEGVVDEIAMLLRSQMAGVIGNLGLVIPTVAAAQGLAWWWAGAPLIDEKTAHHVLGSLTLLGPTPIYAAFTGVLLFLGSFVGGWVENAFAFHQLPGAIAGNPDIVARLGPSRAQRWAQWWGTHINGLSSNIALGLMLGLAPVLAAFAGLPIDVRHVTLSTGQLTAAVATLGWGTLTTPAFGWCVAGIASVGMLNLGVSFALALHVAMKSRGASVSDKRELRRAVWRRFSARPLSFVVQPKDMPGTPP